MTKGFWQYRNNDNDPWIKSEEEPEICWHKHYVLPCPFCAGKADLLDENDHTACANIACGSTAYMHVDAWNDRPTGEPVGEQWCVYEEGEQRTSWYYVGQREGDAPGWEKLVEALPETLQIKKRLLYAGPIVDAEEPVAPTSSPLYSQEMFTAMKREGMGMSDRDRLLPDDDGYLQWYVSGYADAYADLGALKAKLTSAKEALKLISKEAAKGTSRDYAVAVSCCQKIADIAREIETAPTPRWFTGYDVVD